MKKKILTQALLLASVLPAAYAGTMGSYTHAHNNNHSMMNNAYLGFSLGDSQTRFHAYYLATKSPYLPGDAVIRAGKVRNTQPFVGAHLGYSFANLGVPLRLQVRYNYDVLGRDTVTPYGITNNPAAYVNADVKFNSQQVMVDALFDLYRDKEFSVYAGGGAGVAYNRTNSALPQSEVFGNSEMLFSSFKDSSFAYNFQVGADKMLTEHVNVGIFARYSNLGEFAIELDTGDKYAKQISAGLNVNLLFA